jgi:hypothetical protein
MRNLLVLLSLVMLALTTQAQTANLAAKAAAKELLETIDMEAQFEVMLDNMLQTQLEQNPQMVQFEDIFKDFFAKYFTYSALEDKLAELYAESFTAEELKDLIAFYQTPTGKKSISVMPELMMKGMAVGQQIVQEHMPELQQKIIERMNENSHSDPSQIAPPPPPPAGN